MKQTKLEAFGVLQKKHAEQFALRVNRIIAALATEYSALLHSDSDGGAWTIDADALNALYDLSAAFEQRIVERAAVFGEYRTTEEDQHDSVSDKQKHQQKKRPRRRLREMLVEPADFELAIQTLQQEGHVLLLTISKLDEPAK